MRRLQRYLFLAWMVLTAAYFIIRIFLADRFLIPSDSMMPALCAGDRIVSTKWNYGPRLYRTLNVIDGHPDCFRLPGLGSIAAGDVVVFNTPRSPNHGDSVWFTINDVSCKRVLGAPGDRIGAVDGHVWNSDVLKPIGSLEMQDMLRWTWNGIYGAAGCRTLFDSMDNAWTIKNWGPLVVPQKGLVVKLDKQTWPLYRHVVEYETGARPLDSTNVYVFRHDWFFMVGDNAPVSCDSRFYGFVPDDFIVGKVMAY